MKNDTNKLSTTDRERSNNQSLEKKIKLGQILQQPSSFPSTGAKYSTDRHKLSQLSLPYYLKKGLWWGTILSFTVITSAAFGATVTLVGPFSATIISLLEKVDLNDSSTKQIETTLAQYPLTKPVNLLILGTPVIEKRANTIKSDRDHRLRQNSILLLRFDPKAKSLEALSIAGDREVDIPGVGKGTINDAIAYQDPILLVKLVSQTLNNLPIERYITGNSKGFQQLVNAVGGVEVFVSEPLQYTNSPRGSTMDIDSGWQILNGEQASVFAKLRSLQSSDFSGVQQQQVLMEAFSKRFHDRSTIKRIPLTLKVLQQHTHTNLTQEEILTLANFMIHLDESKIRMGILSN